MSPSGSGKSERVGGVGGREAVSVALPPADTRRWVTRRKAEVVAAVAAGHLSREEACSRYGLTDEEFTSWQRLIEAHGVRGLRVTRLKDYRIPAADPDAGPRGDRFEGAVDGAPTRG